MRNFDIEKLKEGQEQLDRRRDALIAVFDTFRGGFFKRIEGFIKEANGSNLRGVKELKRCNETEEYVEYTCTINNVDLNLVASYHVSPLDAFTNTLAAKILVYLDDEDDEQPHQELIIFEGPGDEYEYSMRWFPREGFGWLKARSPITESSGAEAAEIMLDHFYSLQRYWRERPPLGAVRQGKAGSRTIGFPIQKGTT
jgi:hypothetical protein